MKTRASLFFLAAAPILSVALMGCAKEVTREDPQKDTHLDTEPGLFEVTATAEEFKTKVANYHFPDEIVAKYPDHKVVAQLMRIKNETDTHFNTKLLGDKIREILTDSDKVVFMVENEDLGEEKESERYQQESGDVRGDQQIKKGMGAGAAYSVRGRIANIRKFSAEQGAQENTFVFTLQMDDKEQRVTRIISRKEFRLRKS